MLYSRDKNYIEVECPHCLEDNKIKLSSEIKCKHCEKKLTGSKYKSIVISTLVAMSLGAVGGSLGDDILNINRASVKTEFKMMQTCLYIFNDRDNCLCAVESMSGFIDAQNTKMRGNEWLKDTLRERYEDCKD